MRSLSIALFVLAALAAAPARAAGAWIDMADAPTLRQRGWRYVVGPLAPERDTPLAGTAVTRVSWQYHYEPWYRGLQVVLCARDVCIDATTERGWSDAFSGLPVVTRFRFYFVIAGQGMLTVPARGQRVRLIVNFE